MSNGLRTPDDHAAQLDLFRDGAATGIERDLVLALCEQRFEAAGRALARLEAAEPNRRHLASFATLVHDGRALWGQTDDPADCLQRLESDLAPAAMALGARRRDYLHAFWHHLTLLLDAHPYSADTPCLHASYAAGQAGDWEAARKAVEDEAGWERHPVLVARLMEANGHLGEHAPALEALCRLCWDFPETAANHLIDDLSFADAHQAFQALDTELPVDDFPAWYALIYQRRLPNLTALRNETAPKLVRVVNAVLMERAGDPDVTARRELQHCHATLFDCFMALRRAWDA